MNDFGNSMAVRAIVGALIGWLIFYAAIVMIFGSPEGESDRKLCIFLSMAPGVIVGIITAYVSSKREDKNEEYSPFHRNQSIKYESEQSREKTMMDQLLDWKKLKDSGIITEEEFASIKKEMLKKGF